MIDWCRGWLRMLLALAALVLPGPLVAAVLSADRPSPQPAGASIRFTLDRGDGAEGAETWYRLSIQPVRGSGWRGVVFDESRERHFLWTPIHPGQYLVTGVVRDAATDALSAVTRTFTIGPVTPGALQAATVAPTSHPLVALYAAPPCPEPALMRVQLAELGGADVRVTPAQPCRRDTALHFLVAGMRESTHYGLRHQILAPDGRLLSEATPIAFTSGAAAIRIAPSSLDVPATAESSTAEPLIWNAPIIGNAALGLAPHAHATDLDGNLVWYHLQPTWAIRPGSDGSFWAIQSDPVTGTINQVLVQLDLLGNVIKQTSVAAINAQLARLGYPDRINDIHHDVRELPRGRIAFIATLERLLEDAASGEPVSVLGDMIIVTDGNFAIQWVWNGWDHLDPRRPATLGETCAPGDAGCPPLRLAAQAEDWMHANSLAYSPDGDLLLSVRHQDWLLKIAYADGSGDGSLRWRFGPEGDLALLGGSADDWPTHTHDASFIGADRILVYDNGNRRCEAAAAPADCQSRVQVWEIDAEAMTARLLVSETLGDYANAVGSAQQLANGNLWSNSGLLGGFDAPHASLQEMDAQGTRQLELAPQMFHYRSYRLATLDRPPPPWGLYRSCVQSTEGMYHDGWRGGDHHCDRRCDTHCGPLYGSDRRPGHGSWRRVTGQTGHSGRSSR